MTTIPNYPDTLTHSNRPGPVSESRLSNLQIQTETQAETSGLNFWVLTNSDDSVSDQLLSVGLKRPDEASSPARRVESSHLTPDGKITTVYRFVCFVFVFLFSPVDVVAAKLKKVTTSIQQVVGPDLL